MSGRAENCYLPRNVQTGFGAHPASDSLGLGGYLGWVKWPGSGGDHSSPSTSRLSMCVEL